VTDFHLYEVIRLLGAFIEDQQFWWSNELNYLVGQDEYIVPAGEAAFKNIKSYIWLLE
jgi:hypothetical protein